MPKNEGSLLEKIKLATLRALFSDDELMDELVLKGGNALALVYRLRARASVDLDFSLADKFKEDPAALATKIERLLRAEFEALDLVPFDVVVRDAPKNLSSDLADFWGGYSCEFKLVQKSVWVSHKFELDTLRRQAILIGQKGKFSIDFSCHEYVVPKRSVDIDGLTIYAYSPEMIAAEKLRAICQQDPAYGPVVKRTRPGAPRARDFFDLYTLATELNVDVTSLDFRTLLGLVFDAKKVPLQLLGKVFDQREFHRADFPSVEATTAGTKILTFDQYFDFVLDLICKLKPLWNK